MAKVYKIFLVIASISMPFPLRGIDAYENFKTTAFSSLKMVQGARPRAMGGAQVADCEGELALFWNPALLWRGRGGLLFSYNRFRFGLDQGLSTLLYRFSPNGGLALGASYLRVGGIELRNGPTDIPDGTTEARNMVLAGGLGGRLSEGLSVGLAGKFIYEKLHDEEFTSSALDVGISSQNGPLKFGAVLCNLGKKVRFGEKSFPLPTTVRVGAALQFLGMTLEADLEQPLFQKENRKFHFGGELTLGEVLALRGGYTYCPRTWAPRDLTGLSLGIGMDYKSWRLDYAFAPSEDMGDVHQVSLAIYLSSPVPSPPSVYITSPREDYIITETGSINVTGYAEDDRGIKKLEIKVNGKRVVVLERGGRGVGIVSKLSFSRKIELEEWTNRIEVVAYDVDRLSTKKSLTVKYTRKWEETGELTYAVIIGISKYQNENIPELKYADRDAKAFRDFLMSCHGGNVPEENIKFFVNEDATRSNIEHALLEWLPTRHITEKHAVIIFYAGHSIIHPYTGKGIFLTYEADPHNWSGTTLEMDRIRTVFDIIGKKPGRMLFLSDTCHGAAVTSTGPLASRGMDSKDIMKLLSGKGRIIITASGAGEESLESDEYEHGLFTYFLLKGLEGEADRRENGGNEDGLVDVNEVYRYVYTKVEKESRGSQHPQKEEKDIVGIVYLSKIVCR